MSNHGHRSRHSSRASIGSKHSVGNVSNKSHWNINEVEPIMVEVENITKFRLLHAGDHLAVAGDLHGEEYWYHGIFISFTKGVVDFRGEDLDLPYEGVLERKALLRLVDVLEFTNTGKDRLVRVHSPAEQCRSPEEVTDAAERLLENPDEFGHHNFIYNNCQHFATYCKIGHKAPLDGFAEGVHHLNSPIELWRCDIM
ncbi:hypothetical protein LSAT2_002668 [Lamellibrachia satsuma]|nr:hypothetical protein LSAT2_002668 [Lamellibrachia satsuma]